MAVANLRRRNLALSFGVLAILAGTVVMLGLVARRARRLGRQQVEFVAGVSHELRTPVTAIDLAAQNLENGGAMDAERARRYGQTIRLEGRRLTQTVERVLQFASLEAGHVATAHAPLDLAALVDECVADTRRDHPSATVVAETTPDLPAVMGDVAALRTCIGNLLGNAAKVPAAPGDRPDRHLDPGSGLAAARRPRGRGHGARHRPARLASCVRAVLPRVPGHDATDCGQRAGPPSRPSIRRGSWRPCRRRTAAGPAHGLHD